MPWVKERKNERRFFGPEKVFAVVKYIFAYLNFTVYVICESNMEGVVNFLIHIQKRIDT